MARLVGSLWVPVLVAVMLAGLFGRRGKAARVDLDVIIRTAGPGPMSMSLPVTISGLASGGVSESEHLDNLLRATIAEHPDACVQLALGADNPDYPHGRTPAPLLNEVRAQHGPCS